MQSFANKESFNMAISLNPMPLSPLTFVSSSHLNQWIFLHVIWWRVGLHKIQFFNIQILAIFFSFQSESKYGISIFPF